MIISLQSLKNEMEILKIIFEIFKNLVKMLRF